MNFTADTIAFVVMLIALLGTVFNIVSGVKNSSKAEFQRLYDKLETMEKDMRKSYLEENTKIITRVECLEKDFTKCQLRHASLSNGKIIN